jgi:hypothetical protein
MRKHVEELKLQRGEIAEKHQLEVSDLRVYIAKLQLVVQGMSRETVRIPTTHPNRSSYHHMGLRRISKSRCILQTDKRASLMEIRTSI